MDTLNTDRVALNTDRVDSDIANFKPLKNMLTPRDVAEFFNTSVSKIKRLCRNREMGEKIGNEWRISRRDIHAYRIRQKCRH